VQKVTTTKPSGAAAPSGPRSAAIRARAARLLFEPIDAAWLAAFRVLFGAAMCVSMLRFIVYGWIDPLFVTPKFHFKYWGFSWVPDPTAWQAHALFATLAVLGVCVSAGLAFRVTSWAFAVGFAYLQLVDVATYLNHYYLATLLAFLLALSPAHRSYSIDAWIARRWGRPHPRGEGNRTIPNAWHLLFRFQVGVVYTFAGVAKATSDWLLHAQPLRIWLGPHDDLPVLGAFFRLPIAAPVMSWVGFLFDVTIAFWMLWPRARPFAYAIIVVFHCITRALFPIGMFPVIMVLGALVFFSPSWPRIALGAIGQKLGITRFGMLQPNADTAEPITRVTGKPCPLRWTLSRKLAVALGGAYAVLSVGMPLRWLAYDGNILWHEQGMRWSWRVMVREKNGSVTFLVRDPRTGREWQVAPRHYLTRLQEREMSSQPDLILQLAHHIRDEYRSRVGGEVEVRAEALVSLNGRRLAPLVNPQTNLATTEDGIGPAPWITKLPDSAPPHLNPI
jgi:vitamin K-dependent gamma-carboxylase